MPRNGNVHVLMHGLWSKVITNWSKHRLKWQNGIVVVEKAENNEKSTNYVRTWINNKKRDDSRRQGDAENIFQPISAEIPGKISHETNCLQLRFDLFKKKSWIYTWPSRLINKKKKKDTALQMIVAQPPEDAKFNPSLVHLTLLC